MTRILFLGDTHGDFDFTASALEEAADLKCDAVFQVGDFGFLWPSRTSSEMMEELKLVTKDVGIPLFWIDGNHDWHPEIRRRYPKLHFTISRGVGGPPLDGVHHIRRASSLTILGRGLDTLRIVGLGGAPSIDRNRRVEGANWWPEEAITDEDISEVPLDVFGDEMWDILASHDAPVMPPGFSPTRRLVFDARSADSAACVAEAAARCKARLLIHGHWHKRYSSSMAPDINGRVIGVEGLDCNLGRFENAFLVVTKDEDGVMHWQGAQR